MVPVFIATPTSACASAGRVVGAVARHGDEASAGLLALDQIQLVARRGLREEIVDAGFGRDGGGGQRVIAGDHDGANAHDAHLREALPHAALHDVFQMNHAQDARAVRHHERRAAGARDAV